jgi:pyridoxal phosphate enzyme (YggS family)
MTTLLKIGLNYDHVINAINVHGSAELIELIVVSKFQSVEKIKVLLEKGHRSFAESRVEEAEEKWTGLKEEYSDVRLHFVGVIQSKKIKKIVCFFDVIHSVDRLSVAKKIAMEVGVTKKQISCFIQVNIGNEDQKSGVRLEDLSNLYQGFNKLLPGNVNGFMCIPPNNEAPAVFFQGNGELEENIRREPLKHGYEL